jgi:alpha-1,2-mannosyltransferase
MQLDQRRQALLVPKNWQWLAVCCWLLVLAGLFIRLLVTHRLHSVYPIFADAARCWQQNDDLYWPHHYVEGLDPFRYSPSVALFFSTLASLPDRLGSILWLAINALLIVGALWWWLGDALPRSFGPSQTAGVFLVVLAFAAGNLHNGQANTIVTAMLLIAAAAVGTERWTLASACIAVATLFKVYPLAFGLLLALAFPKKLLPRLSIALVIGLALPFLFKPSEYIIRQYQEWYNVVRLDDRRHAELPVCYRDLWLLIRIFQAPIPSSVYTLIQGAGALAAAGICLWGRIVGLTVRSMTMLCLSMTALWTMLLGPATESSTYLIVAPTLAWVLFDAWNCPSSRFEFVPLAICVACFLFAHVSVWLPESVHRGAILFQPTGALFLCGVVLYRAYREFVGLREGAARLAEEPNRLAA